MARPKEVLLTLATGKKHKGILAETIGQMRRYAERIGVDFLVCNEEDLEQTYVVPAYAKFEVISKALEIYERCCFVDADVLISDKAPNIFDVVPHGTIGLFNEAPWVGERHIKDLESWESLTGQKLKAGQYYNTGVMVFDKFHFFEAPDFQISHYGEQSWFNQELVNSNEKVFELDYKWNRMSCTWVKGLDPRDAYFIHFAGQQYPDDQGGLPKFIRERLKEWKSNQFQGISKILIVTGGGMGNQVATIPVVEEIMRMHKGSFFGIHSAYPEVFEHFASDTCEVIKPQGVCPTTPEEYDQYSKQLQEKYMYSRVISTHGQAPFDMTHMNSTDYHSLVALGRQLGAWNTRLPYSAIETDGFTVCLHAGFNAWESKNVPKELYQGICDALKNAGFKVALIGRSDFKEHGKGYGAYKLEGADFDFMDAPLSETYGVIKGCDLLVTNDSMPVHLSPMTNTKTLLITIAKKPELIFPSWFKRWVAATGNPQWELEPRRAFYYPHEKIITTNEWVEGMKWPTVEDVIQLVMNFGDYTNE